MEFYSDGTTMGVSLTLWGLLFFAYVAFETFNLLRTRVFLFHKIYLFFIVKRNLKKEIPYWWKTKISFFDLYNISMSKRDLYRFLTLKDKCKIDIPVDFDRDIEDAPLEIYSWVCVDFFGNPFDKFKFDLDILEEHDIKLPSSVKLRLKQEKRNSILDELGI